MSTHPKCFYGEIRRNASLETLRLEVCTVLPVSILWFNLKGFLKFAITCVFGINPCHAEYIKMPCPLPIFSQSDFLIQVVDINSHTWRQTVQIQIRWLLQKPTDLDLHCLQRQDIPGFSRTESWGWQISWVTSFTIFARGDWMHLPGFASILQRERTFEGMKLPP